MRKSIFLTMVLAFFIGNAVLGQGADTQATPVKPQGCTENANYPAIGVPHSYEVNIAGTGYNGDGVYNWYVTQNAANLLQESDAVAATNDYFDVKASDAEFSTYHETTGTTKKIGLTWKPDALLNTDTKYFLVLKYSEDNGSCQAMNMKVMKIEPLNQFKLKIEPVKDEDGTGFGTGEDANVCAAPVDAASYDAAANKVTYTYGENTLYYKITASGFVGQWKPQLRIPNLAGTGDQKYVEAKWKDADGVWHDFAAQTTGSTQDLVSTDLASIPLPANAGETPTQTYIVKVVIDNEKYETLADQTLNIATDGTYGGANNESLKDQKDDCSADEDDFADNGDYTIKARPTVTATSGGFVMRVE